MELTHEKLPELFEDIRFSKQNSDIICTNYYLNQKGVDVLQICWLGDNEWRFIKDNYPHQRKFYLTNFPIKTTERFISEMKHIGIIVELKKQV